jgi:hypothetical protein
MGLIASRTFFRRAPGVPESAARGSKRKLSASIIAKERLKGMIKETSRQMFELFSDGTAYEGVPWRAYEVALCDSPSAP